MKRVGQLQFIFHAHLPWIRHPEHDFHLEELWLFEAISETYLPLLEVLDELDRDRVPGRITLSLSPPLVAMFDDGFLRDRFIAWLDRLILLGERERARTEGDPQFAPLASMYHERFARQRAWYVERLGGDLCGAFARLHANRRVELITCAATHGLLPLLPGDRSRRAQLRIGVESFERRFGFRPAGLWLPECAYAPGLDAHLAELGVRFTVVDSHGLERASSAPVRGLYAPLMTPHGVAFFARDPESSQQVWSSKVGYPGDPVYRDFYRDIGFDLPLQQVAPWIHPDGTRIHTGFKYHAVTGARTEHKLPYDRSRAMAALRAHADHFVESRVRQLQEGAAELDIDPVITCPYDAELFGHWWFEGPEFIGEVLRGVARRDDLAAVAPPEYLDRWPEQQCAFPAISTWGASGDFSRWVGPHNAWVPRALHHGEIVMRRLATETDSSSDLRSRALAQAARELLLAQSSDWAFILHEGAAAEYATRRTLLHLSHLEELARLLGGNDDDALASRTVALEEALPVFPHIDWRLWE